MAGTGSQIAAHEGPALAARDVSKQYPNGVLALSSATIEVHRGELHGIAGANGAGKSTLVKILGGVTTASSGSVEAGGAAALWRSPKEALRHGVAMMHQNVELLPRLDVLENVFLGSGGFRRRPASLLARYERLTTTYGIWVDPEAEADSLSTGERQMVGLLQALASDPSALILDEPTASLGRHEKSALFRAVANLRRHGVAVILVSHFLDELLEETSRLTIVRDGRTLGTWQSADVTPDELAEMITGGTADVVDTDVRGSKHAAGPRRVPVDPGQGLVLKGVSVSGSVNDLDLEAAAGEVLGIAGLLGSGRSELLQAIYGAVSYRGSMALGGEPLTGAIGERIRHGVGFVPEDRYASGLFREWDIAQNLSIPWIGFDRRFFSPVDRAGEASVAAETINLMAIRARGPETPVSTLSGGNAQKVVVGRWLSRPPRLLLLDEPMHGIDIGARRELQQFIRTLAGQGTVVIVVDSELTSLLEVCDRVVAVRDGEVVLDEQASRLTEHRLLLAINGIGTTTEERTTA